MADRSETSLTLLPAPPDAPASFAGGLLHYRPWSGTLRSAEKGGMALFLIGEALLLVLIAVSVDWPATRLILIGLFIAAWGLVVRWPAWPIARVAGHDLSP